MISGRFGGINPVVASEREAIQKPGSKNWIASSQELLAKTRIAAPIQLKAIRG